ncbi:hypothetical protein HHE02_08450 [Helicobacter heilmannii]|uniref:Uncharacterized protein n=1 Tax=Helicobacter heilmannii TaxID=35817 RepID=A0A0K2XPM8_HELHE|nr:hypothetical protein HHE02_08450 [Helicobacter heilmannii]CRF49096.1 hypothetical protein HHE03_06930 [Helicobacter heilmannii]CRF51042.1 hypothetical protein HHE06_09010 [Helicobacter heilmannii]CRI34831.1 hypothetical protein HHE01_06320 [Helicobacter heilmannii]
MFVFKYSFILSASTALSPIVTLDHFFQMHPQKGHARVGNGVD